MSRIIKQVGWASLLTQTASYELDLFFFFFNKNKMYHRRSFHCMVNYMTSSGLLSVASFPFRWWLCVDEILVDKITMLLFCVLESLSYQELWKEKDFIHASMTTRETASKYNILHTRTHKLLFFNLSFDQHKIDNHFQVCICAVWYNILQLELITFAGIKANLLAEIIRNVHKLLQQQFNLQGYQQHQHVWHSEVSALSCMYLY